MVEDKEQTTPKELQVSEDRDMVCSNCKHYNESCSTGILCDQINGCGLWEGWEPSVKFLSGLILKEDN